MRCGVGHCKDVDGLLDGGCVWESKRDVDVALVVGRLNVEVALEVGNVLRLAVVAVLSRRRSQMSRESRKS